MRPGGKEISSLVIFAASNAEEQRRPEVARAAREVAARQRRAARAAEKKTRCEEEAAEKAAQTRGVQPSDMNYGPRPGEEFGVFVLPPVAALHVEQALCQIKQTSRQIGGRRRSRR